MKTFRRSSGASRAAGPALVLALASLPGCATGARDAGPPALVVAAASDLQEALPAVIEAYRKEGHGAAVQPTFGSSGHLAEQIRAGAPFDLFLAANVSFVDDLVASGAVDRGGARPYAVGALALAVNKGSGSTVSGLADLSGAAVKHVAIANPETAPYGAAARQALTRAGLWEALAPKVVQAASVRQALRFVETGNAEAGLVGKASVRAAEVTVIDVDPALYDPIVQGLGVVAASPRKAEAARFAGYLLGPKGQAVLATFGFRPPPAPGSEASPPVAP